MTTTPPSRQWYALMLRSNHERKAHLFCNGNGLETLLPTYRRRSRKHGGPEFTDRPLFPGYLFAHIDLGSSEKTSLLRAPGIVDLVRFSGKASVVPEREIDSVKLLIQPDSGVQPHPFLRDGMKVEVIAGPFTGARGILKHDQPKRKPTFVLSVEMLGRSIGVPIEPEMVDVVV